MLPLTRVRWRHRRRRLYSVPVAFVLGALVLAWAVPALDRAVDSDLVHIEGDFTGYVFDSPTVAGTLSAIASGMIAFSGLVFTLLLLAVQFGTGQLSARLVPRLANDNVVRSALGVFTGTFVYCLLIAIRLGTRLVDYDLWLSSIVAIGMMLLSTVLFFAMITRMVDLLRTVRVCAALGRRGARYVPATHPHAFDTGYSAALPLPDGIPAAVLRHHGEPAVLVDIDPARLARLARRARVRLTLLPAFGEYTRTDMALCQVWGAGSVRLRQVRRFVAFDDEHAVSGRHPTAMLRSLVDIALKALSPGINDPTTASQALDEIELVLLALAWRELGPVTVRDRDDQPLLDYRLPGWADYLSLATDEIRYYGAGSVQVLRRLRALFTELLAHTPRQRHPAVRQRIAALDAAVRRDHPGALDAVMATGEDRQGLGGPAPYREAVG
jgi:uncharacterized membrane protein